jgi:hypothetical protein
VKCDWLVVPHHTHVGHGCRGRSHLSAQLFRMTHQKVWAELLSNFWRKETVGAHMSHIERDGRQQWWMVSALRCAASSHS